jgi:folate-binding protein YgfZ
VSEIKVRYETRDWIRVRGDDAQRFLQGMLTCDIKKAAEFTRQGKAEAVVAAGLLLSVKGKPVSPLWVFAEGAAEEFWLCAPRGDGAKIVEALDRYLVADDVELTLDDAQAPFDIRVARVLDDGVGAPQLLPPTVPDARDEIIVAVREPWGVRLPLSPSFGYGGELWFKRDTAAARPALREGTAEEALAQRIAAGAPEWRRDFNEESLVLELPFHAAISFYKGCYIGQEVVARGTYRGKMNRLFARFETAPGAALREDFVYAVAEPTKPVGKLTSAYEAWGLGLVRLAALGEPDADKVYRASGLFQVDAEGARVEVTSVTLVE